MKRIELTQGQCAIVDDDDYTSLCGYKWHADYNPGVKSYYAMRTVRQRCGKKIRIRMHREVLKLPRHNEGGIQGDHINHNTLDNRKCNLRSVTNQQNSFNRNDPKGYSYHKQSGKFHARIMVNGKTKSLGYYETTDNARKAYLHAKNIYHVLY